MLTRRPIARPGTVRYSSEKDLRYRVGAWSAVMTSRGGYLKTATSAQWSVVGMMVDMEARDLGAGFLPIRLQRVTPILRRRVIAHRTPHTARRLARAYGASWISRRDVGEGVASSHDRLVCPVAWLSVWPSRSADCRPVASLAGSLHG